MIKLKIKYGNSQTDLRFPCTEKEMNAALERIHAEDVTPLELYVVIENQDFETLIKHYNRIFA